MEHVILYCLLCIVLAKKYYLHSLPNILIYTIPGAESNEAKGGIQMKEIYTVFDGT